MAAELGLSDCRRTMANELLGRCDEVYRLGGPEARRLSNQFIFERLEIDVEDEEPARMTGAALREPIATIHRPAADTKNLGHLTDGRGSKMSTWRSRQDSNPGHGGGQPLRLCFAALIYWLLSAPVWKRRVLPLTCSLLSAAMGWSVEPHSTLGRQDTRGN